MIEYGRERVKFFVWLQKGPTKSAVSAHKAIKLPLLEIPYLLHVLYSRDFTGNTSHFLFSLPLSPSL